MAETQSQPAVMPEFKAERHAVDKDTLIARLDELLEKYLHTLDEYQKAREQFSKQLSSGYLSLAQANFQNRSTTHYGQDSYDERMQASRKVAIQGDESAAMAGRLSVSIISEKHTTADAKSKNEDIETPEPEANASENPEKSEKNNSTKTRTVDPLHWFGILVPPALRSAQSNFASAVDVSVPKLTMVARELRDQEIEIGRVRKQIKKL